MLQRFRSYRTRGTRPTEAGAVAPLGRGGLGFRGVVASVSGHGAGGLADSELERRLLEIGFVEGARVEILHQGAVGGDPIAVRLDDMRVALRRREADAVMVQVLHAGRGSRVRAA